MNLFEPKKEFFEPHRPYLGKERFSESLRLPLAKGSSTSNGCAGWDRLTITCYNNEYFFSTNASKLFSSAGIGLPPFAFNVFT